MASPTQNSDLTFPQADVVGDLNPGGNTQVQVDPISSEVAVSKELKEQAEIKQKKKEAEKKDTLQTLKSAIIISGIVVAVAGAAFAITKKLREK
ncbi:uncharacterized protein LOC130720345 [Lotus japonicus]|uniref:uncharacterized protein LOC130720345 n=1 Tax=Lotus japonicus TaxID=34305 RepID=UPI00258AB48F|nr:uncharacterized protein LOC130720345 [Lotus japonicus]